MGAGGCWGEGGGARRDPALPAEARARQRCAGDQGPPEGPRACALGSDWPGHPALYSVRLQTYCPQLGNRHREPKVSWLGMSMERANSSRRSSPKLRPQPLTGQRLPVTVPASHLLLREHQGNLGPMLAARSSKILSGDLPGCGNWHQRPRGQAFPRFRSPLGLQQIVGLRQEGQILSPVRSAPGVRLWPRRPATRGHRQGTQGHVSQQGRWQVPALGPRCGPPHSPS